MKRLRKLGGGIFNIKQGFRNNNIMKIILANNYKVCTMYLIHSLFSITQG